MEEVSAAAKKLLEFDNHKEIFRLENKDLGVVGFIAIHSRRGTFPSLGATRIWNYNNETEALADALRLSRLMSHKSVFADLPYGGAKAALMIPANKHPDRIKLFSWYASQVNELNGKFITGSDVGVNEEDVNLMRQHSKYIIGDDVPAAYYTALGVLNGIEAVLEEVYGSSDISARTFAVQGLGKTGLELVKLLYGKAKKIFVADIDSNKIEQVIKMFPNLISLKLNEIYSQKVDVFCPCALNHCINSETTPQLRCLAIAGSANNQMESPEIENLVYSRGIKYAIDYIINNGGLISVADQYEHGSHNDERIKKKLKFTKNKLKNIFQTSSFKSISPGMVADNYVESVLNPNIVYHVS